MRSSATRAGRKPRIEVAELVIRARRAHDERRQAAARAKARRLERLGLGQVSLDSALAHFPFAVRGAECDARVHR